jgi:hypothetical protein
MSAVKTPDLIWQDRGFDHTVVKTEIIAQMPIIHVCSRTRMLTNDSGLTDEFMS